MDMNGRRASPLPLRPSDVRDNLQYLCYLLFVPSIPIDTHRLISDLKQDFGFTEKQAEGVATAIKRIDLEHVATKADLRELENRFLRWMIPLLLGQTAVFGLIVKWLVEFS